MGWVSAHKPVAADDLLTQSAGFDCPRPKRLKSLGRVVLPTGEVSQRESAHWVNSASASTKLGQKTKNDAQAELDPNGAYVNFGSWVTSRKRWFAEHEPTVGKAAGTDIQFQSL